MPSRILSQKINVSSSISKLSPMEELLFIHLIVSCDDYGRFYGHPDIVKGMLFSRREFTSKQVETSLSALEREGMIRRYEYDGQTYLVLLNWLKYQSPRAKTSKFPDPPELVEICEQIPTNENTAQGEASTAPEKPKKAPASQARFDTFWKAYPKKQGKKAAEKAFDKIKVDDDLLQTMLSAIETAKKSSQWQRDGGQYIPFPATWLNQGRWEDEPLPASQPTVQTGSYVPNHPLPGAQSDNPFRK